MKHGSNARLSVLAGVFLSASSIAVTSRGAAAENSNPYSAIVERNVFNLHPPPPPVNPADLIKKTPPPKITLTGITTLGRKVAYMTTPPVKPGGPPEFMALAEGQAQNDIEVKSIDERAGVVQVVNHGEPQSLDFDKDGAKPSGPPAGVPTPITLPAPQPAAPPPGVQPMPNPGSMIRPLRSLPSRNSGADNNSGGAGFGGGVSAGNLGQQQNNLTSEEQVALIELQRSIAIKNNDPVKDILPPTELTPEVTGQPGTPTPSGF